MWAPSDFPPNIRCFPPKARHCASHQHLGPKGSGVSQTWVQILDLTLSNCVTLVEHFMLSVPQLSHLPSEDDDNYFVGGCESERDSSSKHLVSSKNLVTHIIIFCIPCQWMLKAIGSLQHRFFSLTFYYKKYQTYKKVENCTMNTHIPTT